MREAKMLAAALLALLCAASPGALGQAPAPPTASTAREPAPGAAPRPPAASEGTRDDREAVLLDLRTAAANTAALTIGLMAAATAFMTWFGTILLFMVGRADWRWKWVESSRKWLAKSPAWLVQRRAIDGRAGTQVGPPAYMVCRLPFYGLAGLAIFCLVVSIYCGGTGLQTLIQPVVEQGAGREAGSADAPLKPGAWLFDASGRWFDWQASMGVIAVGLFVLCVGFYIGGVARQPSELEPGGPEPLRSPARVMEADGTPDGDAVDLILLAGNLRSLHRTAGVTKEVRDQARELATLLETLVSGRGPATAPVPEPAGDPGRSDS